MDWCQIVSWDTLNTKKMFLKNKPVWAIRKCMVTMATRNAILKNGGVPTKPLDKLVFIGVIRPTLKP